MVRHEQQTVRMALATVMHHSSGKVHTTYGAPRSQTTATRASEGQVHEEHVGLRAQKRPLPGEWPAPMLLRMCCLESSCSQFRKVGRTSAAAVWGHLQWWSKASWLIVAFVFTVGCRLQVCGNWPPSSSREVPFWTSQCSLRLSSGQPTIWVRNLRWRDVCSCAPVPA